MKKLLGVMIIIFSLALINAAEAGDWYKNSEYTTSGTDYENMISSSFDAEARVASKAQVELFERKISDQIDKLTELDNLAVTSEVMLEAEPEEEPEEEPEAETAVPR